MADSAEFRSGLTVFLQKKASKRVKNTLFPIMPTFEFLFALSGDKVGPDGLGRPKSGIMIGALKGVASAQREKIFAEREYKPLIQTSKPTKSDVKSMSDYDTDPIASNWTTDTPLSRFSQPRFKFSRVKTPYKVPHSEIRTAKASPRTEGEAAAAIRSVYDSEVKNREAVLCEVLNDKLWGINGQSGAPTNEDGVTWDNFHSIKNALKDDNTYGGVDRSVSANSWWRGNYIDDATTLSFADMIDYCNYDLEMLKYGLGVQIIGVGAALMKKAKAEAKVNSYQLMTGSIPEFPEFGFKREVVVIHSGGRPTYVYYDPSIPAGEAALLDPSTWTVAVHPDGNFKISTPSDQTKVEGGDEADTGTITADLLVCCEVPKGNAYATSWT